MNTNIHTAPNPNLTLVHAAVARPSILPREEATPRYRARDFGVGYGRSSGYASDRCYVRNSVQGRFRVG